MSGFDPAWLDLREPADAAARDGGILAAAASHLDQVGGDVLDLGCGTGATFRAMTPVLASRPRWRLLDNDVELLTEAQRRVGAVGEAETVLADLGEVGALPITGAGLVTASALLDLVSDPWAQRLVERLVEARVGLYAALTYDGSMAWDEPHPLDADVLRAFNAHQNTDKGLGPALGPSAVARVADGFAAFGWRVTLASSPWRLGPNERLLAHSLIAGVADAAMEMGVPADAAAAWRTAREAAAGRSACSVGHGDLLALPA